MHAALDQHAVARGLRYARQHRRWCADSECAGRGRHQQQHRPVEALAEGQQAEQRRHRRHQHRHDENGGHEPAREALRELLRGALLVLRLGNQPHHPAERVVLGETRDGDIERGVLVDRAGEDLCARLLLHWHAFAGDWALVDAAAALRHTAINGDAVAGAHHHHVAHLHLRHRQLGDLPPTAHACGLWHQLAERVHGVASMEEPVPQGDPDFSVIHTDRPGIRKVLGDLEAEVMELIWSRPPDAATPVREVFEVLYDRRRIAYTTVMNTMTGWPRRGCCAWRRPTRRTCTSRGSARRSSSTAS